MIMGGRVVCCLLQLSQRWPCHCWLVGRMKFASLEANFGWVSGPFSLSHSFLSPSPGTSPDMTAILLTGTKP